MGGLLITLTEVTIGRLSNKVGLTTHPHCGFATSFHAMLLIVSPRRTLLLTLVSTSHIEGQIQ